MELLRCGVAEERRRETYANKLRNVRLRSEEIKSRLKSRNACYLSVQIISSSSSLQKNIKSRTYRTTILPIVLHGYETWSHTLRVKQKIFWPNINQENEMAGHVPHMRERRDA